MSVFVRYHSDRLQCNCNMWCLSLLGIILIIYSVLHNVWCLSLLGIIVIGYNVIHNVWCLSLLGIIVIGYNVIAMCDVCLCLVWLLYVSMKFWLVWCLSLLGMIDRLQCNLTSVMFVSVIYDCDRMQCNDNLWCLSLLGIIVIGFNVIGHVWFLSSLGMIVIGYDVMIICDVFLHWVWLWLDTM